MIADIREPGCPCLLAGALFAWCTTCTYAVPQAGKAEPDQRARAWVEIMRILDESVRTLEWESTVTVHHEHGTVEHDLVDRPPGSVDRFMEYRARTDEFRGLRIQGQIHAFTSQKTLESHELLVSQFDGLLRQFNAERDSVVIRAERPDLVYPWCTPSPLTGMGRFINLNQLRSRADHLRDCVNLRVERETEHEVILVGMGRVDHRLFVHRVEIDACTGDVRCHQLIDPAWDALFVEWVIPQWTSMGDARLPLRTEYRVYSPAFTQEERRSLAAARERAGISAAMMSPDHEGFGRWLELRNRWLDGKPTPVRLLTDWQSCETRILSVNMPITLADLVVSVDPKPRHIMSSLLECPVDQHWLTTTPHVTNTPGKEGR